MATYTLMVDIDRAQYKYLKTAGFKLCIARKIAGVYNVVWSGEDFLPRNHFQWQNSYGLFWMPVFNPGSPVQPSSTSQPIAYGQTCLLDDVGYIHPATGPIDHSGQFYLDIQYSDGPVHLGLDGLLGTQSLPMFVSPNEISGNRVTIVPVPIITIMVWFGYLTTGTMFDGTNIASAIVAYQGPTTHRVTYQRDGTWLIQDAFNAELGLLSTPSEHITHDKYNIENLYVSLLGCGTDLALDRDAYSKTAVIGDRHQKGSKHQEWRFILSCIRGQFIIEGPSGGTYLSIDGEPKEGAPVIHGPQKMDWNVELFNTDIRISVPGTDYCVELGKVTDPEKGKVHEIVLAKELLQDDPPNKQLWKPLHHRA